jgi:hypothetical protein
MTINIFFFQVDALIVENTFLSIVSYSLFKKFKITLFQIIKIIFLAPFKKKKFVQPKLLPTFFFLLKYITFICTQIWPSDEQIKKIKKIPILFLSGKLDALVSQQQMKELYELSNTLAGKEWKEFPYGNHGNTIAQPCYWNVIEEFLLWAIFDKNIKKEMDS